MGLGQYNGQGFQGSFFLPGLCLHARLCVSLAEPVRSCLKLWRLFKACLGTPGPRWAGLGRNYPSRIDVIHAAHQVLMWWFFPCASAATNVWGLKAVFTVRCTCPTAGKLPGKLSEFTGSSCFLFLGSKDGTLGKSAVSHGDQLIPQ